MGTFPWRRAAYGLHGMANRHTGPASGPGGTGYFWFAGGRGELDHAAHARSLYSLRYDGSGCTEYGMVGHVEFEYHMWCDPTIIKVGPSERKQSESSIGTLQLVAERPAEAKADVVVWSLTGSHGDAWQHASAEVSGDGFRFDYYRGAGHLAGDIAVANVHVTCVHAPPSLPPSPPSPPPSPPLPPLPPHAPPTPPLPLPPPAPVSPPNSVFNEKYAGVWFAAFFMLLAACVLVFDHCPCFGAARYGIPKYEAAPRVNRPPGVYDVL